MDEGETVLEQNDRHEHMRPRGLNFGFFWVFGFLGFGFLGEGGGGRLTGMNFGGSGGETRRRRAISQDETRRGTREERREKSGEGG